MKEAGAEPTAAGPDLQNGGLDAARGRLLFPDLLRTLAIYLVVGLHTVAPTAAKGALLGSGVWWTCNFLGLVGRMGVPLFFMISGYLLLTDPRTAAPLSFYRRRLGRLLLPFLFWNAACCLLRGLTGGEALSLKTFLQELVQQGSDYHLWFLYQIAAIYLLAPFLRMIAERARRRDLWVLMGVILLVPTLLRLLNICQHLLWFSPFRAPIEGYVGFFLLGYLLGTGEYSPKARYLSCGLGLLALLLAALGNRAWSSPDRMNLYFNEGYALNHYLTASALFLAVKGLGDRLGEGWRKPAEAFSRISFGIYLCHVPLLRACAALLTRWGFPGDSFLYLLCLFCLTALSATLVAWVFSRVPVLRKLI